MPTSLSCLEAEHGSPLSHDNFFHTVLGMTGVSTSVYDRKFDAFAACRNQTATRPMAMNERYTAK